MKLRDLEEVLATLDTFDEPNPYLEQYPTSAHIAARILYSMHTSYNDIEGKVVLDLGCGPSILSIGASLLGAGHVIGVDIDHSALEIGRKNCEHLETHIDFVQMDIVEIFRGFNHDSCTESRELDTDKKIFDVDTVIMNPPFGTRTKGIDILFVQAALSWARNSVYSLHKTSTRDHIFRKAAEWNVHAEVLAGLRFDIPKMYSFHKRSSQDVEVDFWRLHKTRPFVDRNIQSAYDTQSSSQGRTNNKKMHQRTHNSKGKKTNVMSRKR